MKTFISFLILSLVLFSCNKIETSQDLIDDKIITDYKLFARPQQNSNSRPKIGSAEVGVKTPSSVVPEMGTSNETEFTSEDMQKLPYMIHRIKDPAQRKALMEKADRYIQGSSKQ